MIEACYKLRFDAPLHVDGLGTAYYEQAEHFIRSDTLSAALASCWLQLFPEDVETLFPNPAWRISSAFPFYHSWLFLPRPMGRKDSQDNRDGDIDPARAKKIKKLRWLETSIWLQAANGATNWHKKSNTIEGGLAAPGNRPAPWLEEGKPRIAVDRGYNGAADSLIFHFSRIHYRDDAGLYFLARFEHEEAQGKFEAALRLLGDCGIGSDRHCGHGCFHFEHGSVPRLNPRQMICLSLCNPDPDTDMNEGWLDGAAYELVRRGGWIDGSSWRKASLRMFAEGSVFAHPLQGRMIEVGRHPIYGHPVWRDGRAFMVGGTP